jgi:hypothetical protein
MLPIITVGLSEAARAVMDRIPGERGQAHYATAEEALWAFGSVSNPTVAQVSLDARGRLWSCHVFYGDDALGPLLTATELDTKPTRVPAQGLRAVITDTIGSDPTTPVRVVDGHAESRVPPRLAGVEAVKVLQASVFLVVDQLGDNPSWPEAVGKMLDNAEPPPDGETLGFVPGQEAKVELAKAAELRSRGMARPGHFEQENAVLRSVQDQAPGRQLP